MYAGVTSASGVLESYSVLKHGFMFLDCVVVRKHQKVVGISWFLGGGFLNIYGYLVFSRVYSGWIMMYVFF